MDLYTFLLSSSLLCSSMFRADRNSVECTVQSHREEGFIIKWLLHSEGGCGKILIVEQDTIWADVYIIHYNVIVLNCCCCIIVIVVFIHYSI